MVDELPAVTPAETRRDSIAIANISTFRTAPPQLLQLLQLPRLAPPRNLNNIFGFRDLREPQNLY